MGANILSAMGDLLDRRCTVEQFRHAQSYAQLGDNLEQEDWTLLNNEQDPRMFVEIVRALRPVYQEMHKMMGFPAGAEGWLTARYSSTYADKVIKYHFVESSKALTDYFAAKKCHDPLQHWDARAVPA